MKEVDKYKNLFDSICSIIEQGKKQIAKNINSTLTLTYWQIGKTINDEILQNKRAVYGKQIVKSISDELMLLYGNSFELRNLLGHILLNYYS